MPMNIYFLKNFAFSKDLFLQNTSTSLLFQKKKKKKKKHSLISFVFLFWKQTWLFSADKDCLFAQFRKSNITIIQLKYTLF